MIKFRKCAVLGRENHHDTKCGGFLFLSRKSGGKKGEKVVMVVEFFKNKGIIYCKVVESGVEWEYVKLRISLGRSTFGKVLGGQAYVHGQI